MGGDGLRIFLLWYLDLLVFKYRIWTMILLNLCSSLITYQILFGVSAPVLFLHSIHHTSMFSPTTNSGQQCFQCLKCFSCSLCFLTSSHHSSLSLMSLFTEVSLDISEPMKSPYCILAMHQVTLHWYCHIFIFFPIWCLLVVQQTTARMMNKKLFTGLS